MRPSPEQQAIVDKPIESRLVVLAGAGTGKTHTLVARVASLLQTGGVQPGHEILLLTFTRAVVGELRRRIRAAGGSSALIRPLTFDSFATRLLASTAGLETWRGWRERTYDGRVQAAVLALREHDGARERVAGIEHLFVDEIQDLVGIRAEFVLELLRRVPGGFTLLGDPAQGIYDHQVLEQPAALSSLDLLSRVRGLRPPPQEFRLEENFRARSQTARRALAAGEELRARRPDVARVTERLFDVVRQLPTLGRLSELPWALTGASAPTAVLCRNNAQALRVSRELYEQGVDHRVQRRAVDRAVPPWIAELVAGTRFSDLSRSRFDKRYGGLTTADEIGLDPDTAWELLVQASGGDRDRISLARLADRMRQQWLPDDLTEKQLATIVVSTIHRAKGLEFDNVILVEPREGAEAEPGEETRVLYVALTRARDEILTVQAPNLGQWMLSRDLDERWVKSPWDGPRRWKTLGLEIRGNDVDPLRPPGRWLADADPVELQEYLLSEVKRGDEVELELCHVRPTDPPVPFYRVVHAGKIIGVTGEEFGALMSRRLAPKGRPPKRWPTAFTDVLVEGVDAVAGLQVEGEHAGLGASGIWARVRLIGLGRIIWNGENSH